MESARQTQKAERSSNAHEYQRYMGSYIESPVYPHVSATCGFRVPPPAAAATFRVPPLRCSFPSLLHPQYQLVKEQCDSWILGIVQPPSPAARRLLLDCLIPRLTCRNIPTASSLPRLIQATKMVSWLVISDDEDDLPDALGANVNATAESAALVMAILRQLQYHDPTSLEDAHAEEVQHSHQFSVELSTTTSKQSQSEMKARALQALAELWGEMHKDMAPNLRARFVSAMADYLDALKAQAAYRNAHRLPDMEAYMEIRRQASFILPSFCLVEYAVGIELDDDVYAHPQVQEFRSTVVDYICLCNDLLSCRPEIGVGDYFNMPSIVYSTSTNKEAFQDAINFVGKMVDQLDAQLVSMADCIYRSPLPSLQCPSVKAYVAALGSSTSGSLAWFHESARYCNP